MKVSVLFIVFICLLDTSCENNPKKSMASHDGNSIRNNNTLVDDLSTTRLDTKIQTPFYPYVDTIKITDLQFDTTLELLLNSCGGYAYFDDFFRIPYNGCVYNPKENPNNSLGWADIVLIPYKPYVVNLSKNWDENNKIINSLETTVNTMSVNDKKAQFKILIFIIDKKYLYYEENSEIPYYPNIPYVVNMYSFDKDFKKWDLVNSIEIHKESDELSWVNTQINKNLTDTVK